MRSVLKTDNLTIEIPHDRKTIMLTIDDVIKLVEALGTGIHQLIIMATKVILHGNSVILLEEPELHLHPELQRQLMNFFANETDNQYFLTTHSATIMDSPLSTVTSVKLFEGMSICEMPVHRNDKHEICRQLGYRPSDLLQSNFLIWVEGPSDRIYLNFWINTADPELKEGWHYTIMFYGGRLLSHLTADEPVAPELIDLMSINRLSAIVIDSDKPDESAPLNATKMRLQEEFNKINGFVWVTAGREIENYLGGSRRLEAVKATHKRAARLKNKDARYSKPLEYVDVDRKTISSGFDKVGIAVEYATGEPEFDVFDLEHRVTELVDRIRSANGLDPVSLR